MRNFKIFQNSFVWKILRENVNFLNISEYFWKMFRIKIMRKIFTRVYSKNFFNPKNVFQKIMRVNYKVWKILSCGSKCLFSRKSSFATNVKLFNMIIHLDPVRKARPIILKKFTTVAKLFFLLNAINVSMNT